MSITSMEGRELLEEEYYVPKRKKNMLIPEQLPAVGTDVPAHCRAWNWRSFECPFNPNQHVIP